MVLGVEIQLLLILGICIISSFVASIFLRKFKLPLIIGPLLIGLFLNYLITQYDLTILPFRSILELFANFGLVMMLFLIGLKVDFRYMKRLSKESFFITLCAAIIPFIFGILIGYAFTKDIIMSLFVGIALAITAEEVAISILDEVNMLKKKIGQLIMEAGIIGDVFEIAAIALLGVFIKARTPGTLAVWGILIDLMLYLILILFMRYYLIDRLLLFPKDKKYEYFKVAIIVLLIMTIAAELLNFNFIIGALIAGLLLKDKLIQDKMYLEEHHITESIEIFIYGIFRPLVFIWIGLSIDLSFLFNNLAFGIILTLVALSSKLIGAVIGTFISRRPLKEGIFIGWGLNARGATELFTVLIAKNQGFLSQDVFSAIVFMALVTTIVSPIMFKIMVDNRFLKSLPLPNIKKKKVVA